MPARCATSCYTALEAGEQTPAVSAAFGAHQTRPYVGEALHKLNARHLARVDAF